MRNYRKIDDASFLADDHARHCSREELNMVVDRYRSRSELGRDLRAFFSFFFRGYDSDLLNYMAAQRELTERRIADIS